MVGRSFVPPARMLSLKQAAEQAGVDERTIKRAIRAKELLAQRRGMRTVIAQPALSLWQAMYWGQLAAAEAGEAIPEGTPS